MRSPVHLACPGEGCRLDKGYLQGLVKDFFNLFIVLIVVIFSFKIIFFNEPLFGILKAVVSFFWLFLIPGFCILNYWKKRLNSIERIILSIPISFAYIGIFSYYFGLVGINIGYSTIILPLITLSALVFNGEN